MVPFSALVLIAYSVVAVSGATVCTQSISIGYDVNKVSGAATSAAVSNWEWGTQAEALLELDNPTISVFSNTAFPGGHIPKQSTVGTTYAKPHIRTSGNILTAAGGKCFLSTMQSVLKLE